MTTLPAISLPNDRYRRTLGVVLGALVGIVFAAVWQVGNRLAVPGAPLYQPPLGLAGNVLLFGVGAAVLGMVAGWPRSGLSGAFVAAAVSATGLVAWAYAQAAMTRQNIAAAVVTGLFVVLPFWGLLVPALGALRWVVDRDEESRRDHEKWPRRLWPPLLLLVAVALIGLTALYPQDARVLISRTDDLLQSAQAGSALPRPLAETEFASRGQVPYELSWEHRDIEKYRIPRPGRNFENHSVVVARFRNGWNLVCLYITLEDPPLCQGLEELPR